jgi:hypothetical protein
MQGTKSGCHGRLFWVSVSSTRDLDKNIISWYRTTMVPRQDIPTPTPLVEVERVQTGVRLEKRMLKVLKAVAELKDMSLGDLIEGVVLHAFEGKAPFSAETLKEIEQFKKIYGLTLKASDSHQLKERKR